MVPLSVRVRVRHPYLDHAHWPDDTGRLNWQPHNYIGACFLYRAWAGKVRGRMPTSSFGLEDYDSWLLTNALFRITYCGVKEPLYRYRIENFQGPCRMRIRRARPQWRSSPGRSARIGRVYAF